jgi:hypothetical protein
MKRSFNNVAMFLLGAVLLAGCQEMQDKTPLRALTLPDNAKSVAEGAGRLSFHVADDGRVFVYDVDAAAVVGASHVRAGQQFVATPDSGVATLDGRKVLSQGFTKGHSYRLYFEPE